MAMLWSMLKVRPTNDSLICPTEKQYTTKHKAWSMAINAVSILFSNPH